MKKEIKLCSIIFVCLLQLSFYIPNLYAEGIAQIVVAKIDDIEITFAEYKELLTITSKCVKRKLLDEAINEALLYKHASKIKEEYSLKFKEEYSQIFTPESEEILQEQLANAENERIKRNVVANSLKEKVSDEYLLSLRNKYRVLEHFSLLDILIDSPSQKMSCPIIILPVTFKKDFSIVQERPIIYNLPDIQGQIAIIFEVRNDLPATLIPSIQSRMRNRNCEAKIMSNGTTLNIQQEERNDERGEKVISGGLIVSRIKQINIISYINNFEGLNSLQISLPGIGCSMEDRINDFNWQLQKQNGVWKEKQGNTPKKVPAKKPKDVVYGLDGFKITNLTLAKWNNHPEAWECKVDYSNKSIEAVYLIWPPQIKTDKGAAIKQVDYKDTWIDALQFAIKKDMTGYVEPRSNEMDIPIDFGKIPFSIKELNFVFQIKENKSPESKTKKIQITMSRDSDESFKYKPTKILNK